MHGDERRQHVHVSDGASWRSRDEETRQGVHSRQCVRSGIHMPARRGGLLRLQRCNLQCAWRTDCYPVSECNERESGLCCANRRCMRRRCGLACGAQGRLLDRHQPLLDPSLHARGSVRTHMVFRRASTALTLTDRDEVLTVVLGSRLILWEPATDMRHDHAFHLEGWPKVRLNDARSDPRGSLWVGSMRNNVKSDGSSGAAGGQDGVLFRLDPDAKITQWQRDIGISNTLAWSPDQRRFYFGDTLANTVWVYDYDLATGTITNQRPFLEGFARGLPDGSTVDSEGYLWNCRFFGGCIVRVAPDWRIACVVVIPVTNMNTCTFGGPDRKTLYVTTASIQAPPSDRLAGSLYAIDTEVAGQPENRFCLFGRAG